MITEYMQLNSVQDARTWAGAMAVQTDSQHTRVADYIWEHKPRIGCTYSEFREANPDFCDIEKFWEIAGD